MPKATRAQVYAAIDSERDYQDMRAQRDGSTSWVNDEERGHMEHSHEEWLIYMDSYLREAKEKAARVWGKNAQAEVMEVVRKVTALGVAAMEACGAPQRAGFERP
jgi:hypothetical protein